MESSRHILPSSLEHHNFALEDGSIRTRRPLSSSAGNAQLSTLASPSYHGDKGYQPRLVDVGTMHSSNTVPSQSPRESAGYTLQQRKQHNRSQREQKHTKQSRNPIVDSVQYQAYRERATREGNPDDQKWPDVLEDAFLEALLVMPIMGRRKFSYRGKPHGRNELIAEYLWIYYLQSLSPGEIPDQTMRRHRKQVSSHIQVIKGFLKTHPYIDKIFPKSSKLDNGFQDDSFKNNPCLRAISEGRLPSRRFARFNNHSRQNDDFRPPPRTLQIGPIRPCTFWLLITPHEFPEKESASSELEDLYRANMVAHRFSNLSTQAPRDTLDVIPDWQHRFPKAEHLRFMGNLNCDIIHMDVALEVMREYPGKGAELCCRTEVTIPGRVPAGSEWILQTTLTKPIELCRNGIPDRMPEESQMTEMAGNEVESRFKVPFPASSWAVAITRLIDIQKEQNDQDTRLGRSFNNSPVKSARKCIEEISMYQEILCSTLSPTGQRNPLVRKAIILWTFRQTHSGESGHTTWRYIDAVPSRRTIMSPSPSACHQVSSAMYENFHSSMHHPTMLNDPYSQGLATPPLTGGIHSQFDPQSYNYPPNIPYDLPADHLSFMSSKTADSESTLVDDNHTGQLDQYLSNNLHLNDYDNNGNWQVPAASEIFDGDSGWTTYETTHHNTPQIWDHPTPILPSTSLVDLSKSHQHQWHDLPSHHHQHQQKTISWMEEIAPSKPTWLEDPAVTSPDAQQREGSYLEQPQPQQQQQQQLGAPWMEGSNGSESTKNNSMDLKDSSVVCSILELTGQQQAKWAGVNDNNNVFGFVRG